MSAALASRSSGYLPYWLVFTAFLSLSSTVQCYIPSNGLARTLYWKGPATEVTPLVARLFGTWNFTSTVVRLYSAYYIHEKGAYALGMWTYVIALAHFGTEYVVGGTVGGKQLIAAEMTPVVSLLWMVLQWGYYVRA